MKKNPLFQWSCWLVIAVFFSCAEKQDFSQYDDLSITPALEASLLYVETPENFINEASAATYYSQEFNFDAFEEQFVSDNVLDAVITYELENTTSKPLELVVEFLDTGGAVLDTETFLIDPAPTAVLRREVTYGGVSGRSIAILQNTSGIRVNGRNLGDTTSVSNQADPKFIFRSSAQLRIRLK